MAAKKKAVAKKAPAKKAPAKKKGITAEIVRQDGTVILSNGQKTTCAIGRYNKPVANVGDEFVKTDGRWELKK